MRISKSSRNNVYSEICCNSVNSKHACIKQVNNIASCGIINKRVCGNNSKENDDGRVCRDKLDVNKRYSSVYSSNSFACNSFACNN